MRLCLLVLLLAACPDDGAVDDDDASADSPADDDDETVDDDDDSAATDDDDALDDDDSAATDDDDAADDDDDTESTWVDCPAPVVEDPPPDPADCNADGVLDTDQLASGEAFDCNADGILDECQVLDDACQTYGAREFTEYDAGSLPIVLSAPHGGLVAPDDIPDRAAATGSRDVNTIQLARAIDAALFDRTGKHVHLVICQLHRDKIDCNRSLELAQDGHPETEAAWFEYHAAIDAAKRTVEAQFGRGLYIDLHGLAASRPRNELGYLLYSGQLYESDERLSNPGYARRSSMRTLAEESGDLVESLRGLTSLGAHLQAAGFDSVPSPSFPDPGTDGSGDPNHYFNGGYNTSRHGSQSGGAIDGLQIETVWDGVRDSEASREAFAAAVANGVLAWLPEHLQVDPEAASLVRLGPVHGRASERGALASVSVRRSGDSSEPLDVALSWSGSAELGVDLATLPATASFSEGQDEVLIEIEALADTELEGPETLQLNVEVGAGYNRAPGATTRTIRVVDADGPGLLVEGVPSLVEAEAGVPLALSRDSCGLPLDVTALDPSGRVLIDAQLADGLALSFGPDEAALFPTLTADDDGATDGPVEFDLEFEGPSDAVTVPARIVDPQDSTRLAWFDGRVSGEHLVEAGAVALEADVLPSAVAGPQSVPGGPAGHSLEFDGDDDLVMFDDLAFPGAFSVVFGFRAADDLPDGFRYLYGHGNINATHHLNVYLSTAGTVRTSLRGSDDDSDFGALDVPGDYRDGDWHHYALVVNPAGPTATVWVDGVLAATAARGGSTFDPGHPVVLGARWDLDSTRDFAGGLDEIGLFDRALSEAEVLALSAVFAAP